MLTSVLLTATMMTGQVAGEERFSFPPFRDRGQVVADAAAGDAEDNTAGAPRFSIDDQGQFDSPSNRSPIRTALPDDRRAIAPLQSGFGGSRFDVAPPNSELPRGVATGFTQGNDQALLVPISPDDGSTAAAFLRRTRELIPSTSLPGRAWSLRELIEATRSPDTKLAAVMAYWRLSIATANYAFAAGEMHDLAQLPVPQAPPQQKLLNAAMTAARAAESETRLAAIQAQYALAEMADFPAGAGLPLAGDLPLIGPYNTHFETLHARGMVGANLRPIHATLPVMQESISLHAEALLAADELLAEYQQAYEQGEVPVQAILELLGQRRTHRRQFLTAVNRYNEHIARYAMSVARAEHPADRIAGMLIRQPMAERANVAQQDPTGIRRVSGEEAMSPPSLPPDSLR